MTTTDDTDALAQAAIENTRLGEQLQASVNLVRELQDRNERQVEMIDRLEEQVREHAYTIQTRYDEGLRWIATLLEAGNRYAKNNNFCGVYDEFLEEVGLPARPVDYMFEVEVKMVVSVPVTLPRSTQLSSDTADRHVDPEEIRKAILENNQYRLYAEDWSVDDWSAAD